MAVEEVMLSRIRDALEGRDVVWEEKSMFGGICFMVDGKMCFGANGGDLTARVDPSETADLVGKKPHAEQMLHRGREFAGYLWVRSKGLSTDEELGFWIDKCLEYNPQAKPSKRR